MEDDMNHQLKLKDMKIDELYLKIQQLEKQVDVLKVFFVICYLYLLYVVQREN